MTNDVSLMVKAISILRNHLELAEAEITALLKEQPPQPFKIEQYFPQNLQDLLSFTEKDDLIIISPKEYLGSENFARIASIVRELGGTYISAGKNSHFEVHRKAA